MGYGSSAYGDTSLGSTSADTPTLGTGTATAQASGNQLQVSGAAQIQTITVQATGTGQITKISGSSTLNTATSSADGFGALVFIEPDFALFPTEASATGNTLNLSGGTTTIRLETADATYIGDTLLLSLNIFTTGAKTQASGIQNLNITPNILVTGASADASGKQISISGSTTATSDSATTTGSGTTSLKIKPNLFTETATSSATGEKNLALVPNLITESSAATATGSELGTDVIGHEDEITVLIEGERIDTYTNIEVKKRLNEVDTFSFQAFIEDSTDRALIQEGNTVKIIENYSDLLFKGVLNEVKYKSSFRAECEGNGMVQKLLDRKTDRDTYTNTVGDDIIKSEVPETVIDYGTIESAPNISVRFDHDNLARAVAGVSNATGYDWFIDQKEADDFDTDYLNFVEDAGASAVQETFDIGGNARLIERNKDEGFIANDITLLGRGDGINQLQANVFAASDNYTETSQVIDETETGSFTVRDTSQLGATGDNLLIRVGTEVMDVNISDNTTLNINSRGLNDYSGDATEVIKHYENIRVWRLENITTGVGRFSPENPETGSSIDTHNVKEQRETDKTIVDISTLEKTADLELRNRFEDVFRVQVKPTDPRVTQKLDLGDTVVAEDLTAMDVSDEFNVVGMDVKRNSSEEGTVLHLANRPRRLTERLSEIESNTDTLNAHMQGATNFNGEHFEDNVDNSNPLTNSVFVPDDVVAVNKFELTFKREPFRGYVQNSSHSHDVSVTHPSHSHDVDVTHPSHSHDVSTTTPAAAGDAENANPEDLGGSLSNGDSFTDTLDVPYISGDAPVIIAYLNVETSPDNTDLGGGEVTIRNTTKGEDLHSDSVSTSYEAGDSRLYQAVEAGDGDLEGDSIEFTFDCTTGSSQDYRFSYGLMALGDHEHNISTTSTSELGTTNSETSTSELGTTSTETSGSSGSPVYGLFEPSTEPDVDVDIVVDGTTVTTVNNVSVGQKISTPIDLKPFLADPLTGAYHDIELVPVDTGGGNNGRARLSADITEKVFIESTL